MIDAIIFDFDGVILDSEPLHYEACCVALKNLGIVLNYDEYKSKYLGQSDKDMFPRLLSDKGCSLAEHHVEELIESKVLAYSAIIETREMTALPDFEHFLLNIAERINKFAICSGSSREVITAILEKLNRGQFKSYFNTIISCEDVQVGKPSPEGYLLTARQLSCSPEHCFVIEDSPPGIKAARDAGMRVVGLLSTYNQEQLAEAHLFATDFNDLITKHNNYFF